MNDGLGPSESARRSVLLRLALMAVSLVSGVFAAPKDAVACATCCSLCFAPTGYNPSSCDCEWAWQCPDNAGPNRTCYYYGCAECIKPPQGQCTLELCNQANMWNACATGCAAAGAIASRSVQLTNLGPIPGCTPA